MLATHHPLQLVLGLCIWAIWFVVLYAMLSISCSVDPPAATKGAYTWLNGTLLLLTVITTVVLLNWAKKAWRAQRTTAHTHDTTMPRPTRRFINWIAIQLNLLAAVATFAIGIMVVFLPPCL